MKVERKVEGKLKISILTPPLAKDLNHGLVQTREQHGKTSVKFNLGADEREHFLQDERLHQTPPLLVLNSSGNHRNQRLPGPEDAYYKYTIQLLGSSFHSSVWKMLLVRLSLQHLYVTAVRTLGERVTYA